MDNGATSRLSMANSPARKRKKSATVQDSYHNIASTFFSLGKGNTTDLAFLEAARDGDYEKIEELLQRRNESLINVDVRDKETGNTPIIWAAKRGHIKIVQLLLKNGADVTLRNYDGQTAVEVASPQVQQLLLDSVDKGGPHRNLLQAAWQGCARLVRKILTETRVDINCKNADGLTPLLLVTRDIQLFEKLGDRVTRGYDPVEVMELLLTYRADPNMEDEEGKTALHYASSSKAQLARHLVEQLLTDGSDIDARDRRSFTPIHCASQSGNVNVVVALLDGGSDANARGYAGTTPLHVSAINGHDQVACTLLDSGADVTLVDDSGLTAVDVAKTKKVKSTLKQAWTEATQGKSEKVLNPLRNSVELKNKTPRKRGGQVIFDIPELWPSAQPPRILVNDSSDREAPITVSLINLSLAASSCTGVDPLTPRRASAAALERHLNNIEKARKAEEQMYRELNEGCGHAPFASQVRGRTPRTGQGNAVKRLTPIRSPRKNSTGGLQKEIRFCPGTKAHDGRCDRIGSAGKHQGLKKCYSDPSRYQDGPNHQIPVTILGLDLDENLQEVRVKRMVHGPSGHVLHKKGHSRHFSDPSSGLEYDDIYLKGRSPSKLSMTSVNEDFNEQDDCYNGSPPRYVRTPSASSREARLRIPQTIDEAHSAGRRPYNLDLDRMHVTNRSQTPVSIDVYNYPNSNHLLPSTPQLQQQDRGDSDYSSDHKMTESQEPFLSSKESSPRSDEEEVQEEPPFFDYHKQVKLAINNVQELNRSKSTLMQGTFDISKSRVRKSAELKSSDDVRSSNDSGCSVDSSTEKPESKNVPKLKYSESQAKKENVGAKGENKKKSSLPRTNCTQSRITSGTENCKSSSSSGQTENYGPRNVSVVGKTVIQPQKTTTQETGVQNKKIADNLNNTYVTVVKTPKVDTNATKLNSCNVPNPSTAENKSSVRSTYETVRTAPCSDKKPACDENGKSSGTPETYNTPKLTITTGTNSQEQQNVGSKSKLTQRNSNQSSSQKSTPPSRPAVPPRQNSNLTKTKSTPKPIKKENSTVGSKSNKNSAVAGNKSNVPKQQSKPGNSKPVVPPRPQSVLSGNVKQPEIPQAGPKTTNNTVGSQPQMPSTQKPKNPPANTKPATAPTSTQQPVKQTVVPAATNNEAAKTAGTVPVEETKKEPPPVPPRPRSVKAKLIKVASSESCPKDLQSTYTVDELSKEQQKQQQQSDRAICKITINGKESTVPDYNPKSKEVQNPTSSPQCARKIPDTGNNVTNTEQARGNHVHAVKVIKVDSDNTEEPTEVKFVPRPELSEHEGPVIWDPFEKIREQNQKSTEHFDLKEEEGKARSKSAKGTNNRLTVPGSRKPSAKNRSNSATKRSIKVKPVVEANKTLRPKSPKKKTVKKKKKPPNGGKDLTNKGDPDNVAFVSGIGWHLDYDQAPTFTKVRPFKFKPPGDYSSEEEDYSHTPRVHPDYSTGQHSTPRSFREMDSLLPNMTVGLEELEEYTSADESDDAEYVDAEDVLDDVAEFRHPRDSMNDDESSVSEESAPSKTLTNVTTLSSNYKSSNLPHVAKATKVTLEQTDLGSSQKVEAKAVPDVENIKSEPTQTSKNKIATAKVIAVKSAGKENKIKTTRDASPNMQVQNVNSSALSPNSQKNGKKQVSNPISPGASVPERRPSFNRSVLPDKSPNSSPSKPDQPKTKSIRIEKTKTKPKHEPLAQSEEIKKDNNNDVKVSNSKQKQDKEHKESQIETQDKDKVVTKEKNVRNSNEDLENIIDEIIKCTPNPTVSFKSNEVEKSESKKKKSKKHSRERFEKEMRGSHYGKTFKQIQNSSNSHDDGGSDGTSWKSSSTTSSGATDELQNLNDEFDIESDEKHELERLMKSLKNMELMVSLPMQDDELKSGIKTPALNRPPLPPKASAKMSSTRDNRDQPDEEEMGYLPDKSPRFIRKRDSLRDSARKNVKFHAFDFDSDTFGSLNDDTLVPEDSRVVTSRMGGRRSAACSRCSSSLNDTLQDDNIETIQWKRGNQLGKGAYGTVWCGLTNAGELIAVKQIELNTADMDMAEEEYEKIHEEVDLLKTLNHKNIVGYLGTSLEDHIVSIFMEFVPGGSIGSILARFGALEEEVFRLYTKQILEGIEYLHANNVIHRDIKGGNIMLMPNGVIKLIDFGCAKRLCLNVNAANSSHGSSRLLKSMRGTPYWMAPEVVKETGYGTKSDIWSIGCTVFEMATRKPPWADVPPMAAIFAIGSDKPVPQLPEKCSQDARDFVNACLTRCQSTRPNATQLLQHSFMLKKNARKK